MKGREQREEREERQRKGERVEAWGLARHSSLT
jgi:hypothetical protein